MNAPDPALVRAAEWHDQLSREEVGENLRADFARWLHAAPENRAAYESIERTWRLAHLAADDPRILALRHETALRLHRRTSRRSRITAAASAAALLLVLGSLFSVMMLPEVRERIVRIVHIWQDEPGHYATAVGERLTVALDDGSQVTLNTHTKLRADFTPHERSVLLASGQALFEVATDPARPFVVQAGGRRFVAVGTAFDVRVEGPRIQITMLEGTVRVERAESGARPIATLTAGEQLTVDEISPDRVRIADPEGVTSWRRGQVIFESTSLVDAIAEMNRYSSIQVTLADPALAGLRISGAFATGRQAVFIEALTTYFPISVIRVNDTTLMLDKRQDSARLPARQP